MPNLKAFLDDNEQYQLEITAPNGHKYGFPYVEEMKGLVLTPGPFVINKTWLDKVGKEVPTTVDEWVDCLKAIRDGGDLNGNGEDDEIPMATWFGATDTFGPTTCSIVSQVHSDALTPTAEETPMRIT